MIDTFSDNHFFEADPHLSEYWQPLINALMESDKERLPDLLGGPHMRTLAADRAARIYATPSANIFTNREQEMLSRSMSLRRLSFVLLSAHKNHYLSQLPAIQEKLVDILRTDIVSPRVHSEVKIPRSGMRKAS